MSLLLGGLLQEMLTCALSLRQSSAICVGGDEVEWGGVWHDGLAGRGVAWFN